jgi:hypothetical protein
MNLLLYGIYTILLAIFLEMKDVHDAALVVLVTGSLLCAIVGLWVS